MIIGAQLYTIRDFIKTDADFAESMKKISKIGFSCVQISGIGPIDAETVRKICDDNGLNIILTHTNQDRIKSDTEKVIEEHNIMGADYVGIGSMPQDYRNDGQNPVEGIKRFIDDYMPAAEKIKKAGKMFMYHNHDFEFEKFDGKLMMEYLVEGFPADLMGFTLDTFWVQAGGADPALWLETLSGRLDTIHFKDYAIQNRTRIMAEVLEGNLNWDRIFEACKATGTKWAFIEQDNCNGRDPFESLRISFENLKSRGFK